MRCRNGHESAATDYCDVCGVPMGAPSRAAPAPVATAEPAPAPAVCGGCGQPMLAGARFCEACGWDAEAADLGGRDYSPDPEVTLSSPAPGRHAASPSGVTAEPSAAVSPGVAAGPGAAVSPGVTAEPSATPGAGAAAGAGTGTASGSRTGPGTGWHVLVVADRSYFDSVLEMDGADAGDLTFPAYWPERRFALDGDRLVIGRRSRSRGTDPDIDLGGQFTDPGVSHLHAMLAAQPGGTWAVVDLGSSNGTYLNESTDPLTPHVPVAVGEGDRIHLGAWTTVTLHAG